MVDSKDESQKKEARLAAQKKMMDLVAVREHSEKELRQKMSDRFATEDVDAAIEYGKAKGWIAAGEASEQALAKELAEALHRKGKGIEAINHVLREKGLPELERDSERELEKARHLLENKFSKKDMNDPRTRAQAGRFLASRGFEEEIVQDLVFKGLGTEE